MLAWQVILEQKDKIDKMEKQIKYMREKAKSVEDKAKEERKINANGTFFYKGEMCIAVLLEEGSQVNELREKVCNALDINLEGTRPLLSSSQVSNTCSQEMGLVSYLPKNANEILTGKGQLFDSPDLFKQSVLLFAASNKFSFNYLDNSRAYYRLGILEANQRWKFKPNQFRNLMEVSSGRKRTEMVGEFQGRLRSMAKENNWVWRFKPNGNVEEERWGNCWSSVGKRERWREEQQDG
ncbi:hypothetical protein RHMOL_Rhmol12G0091300 [Rhododendron molle]|uniref:Uncharacterized protein n=1 Tax=Rhododendron molle TaxID=49168 RepID=A0ACC0LG39_RHOML|nr:hypothetical protein RHMOL_Rhmol12G0091300 [Rhododendron molle]